MREFAAIGFAATGILRVVGAVRGCGCDRRGRVMMADTMRMYCVAEDQPGRQQQHYCQSMQKPSSHARSLTELRA